MTIHASPNTGTGLAPELQRRLEASLEAAAASRERQLAELPPIDGDLVASAHRDSVARILSEIRSAQARLAAGRYGRCERCATPIPPERLELRPWTTACVGCSHLARP